MRPNHAFKHCPTLSARLTVLFVLMAIITIIAVASTLGWALRGHFEDTMRPHLMQYVNYIKADIGSPPELRKAQTLAQKLKLNIQFISPETRWSTQGRIVDESELSYENHFVADGVEYSFGHDSTYHYIISRQAEYQLAFIVEHHKGGWAKFIVGGLTLLMIVLLYYATRRLFSPIDQIKAGVEQIGQGNLKHKININRRDELGQLGTSINAMADNIQGMLDAKRQLLLAISHELRSPLTRAKLSAELVNDESQRDNIQQDLNEMENLIQEILETERLANNHQTLNCQMVTVQPVIQSLINDHFSEQALTLDFSDADINTCLDTTRFKLLLKNLIGNALEHSDKATTPPIIKLDADAENLHLQIQDFGPGIEEQHLPHLTEPFYRVDPARQRQTGGYGLGLYLCKLIAQAHEGKLVISSDPGQGTRVSVTLPIRSQDTT